MQIQLNKIISAVSNYYEIPIAEIKGKTRKANIVKARQVYFYLARVLTHYSLAKIAENVYRDHATAMHGIKTIKNELDLYKELQEDIEMIEENLVNPLVIKDINLLELSKNYGNCSLI